MKFSVSLVAVLAALCVIAGSALAVPFDASLSAAPLSDDPLADTPGGSVIVSGNPIAPPTVSFDSANLEDTMTAPDSATASVWGGLSTSCRLALFVSDGSLKKTYNSK